ncbi:MAG: hypothetical protein HRU22_13305 [Gammaproteobacteria bacterium]|nr:hypothetical protein [Gammaproteobacteria bacterium]
MYSEILEKITSNDIQVCILRDDPQMLTDLPELDLLINAQQIHKVLSLLTQQGWVIYKNGKTISNKHVAIKIIDSRSYLLDIHASLIQNNIIYLDTESFFIHCNQISHNLYQPSSEAYLYHLFCHVVLGKNKLADKYISKLKQINLSDQAQNNLVVMAQSYGTAAIIETIYHDPIKILTDIDTVKQLKKLLQKSLMPMNRAYYWRKITTTYYQNIAPLFGRNRGIAIAFIGPDGAGKSTFIEQLEQRLKAIGIPTRNAYMGPWFRNKLFTTVFLDSIAANPKDEIFGLNQVTTPLSRTIKITKGLIRRYLYYINAPLESNYRYFRYVYLQSLRGRVVLIDRYTHDLEVGYKNREVKNGKFIRQLIVKFSPSPDAMFLLYNDPDTVWQRKKEYELPEIRWSMEQYLNIATKYKIEKIKTDQECSILVDQFIQQYWKIIYQKKADFK